MSFKKRKGVVGKHMVQISSTGYATPLSAGAGSEAASQSPPPSPAQVPAATPPLKIRISKKKKKRGRKKIEVSTGFTHKHIGPTLSSHSLFHI